MDYEAWTVYLDELDAMSTQERAFEVETWTAILHDDEAANKHRRKARSAIGIILLMDSNVEAVLA